MNAIRIRRYKAHMSQRQLAAELGVTTNTVSGWEIGTHVPDRTNLRAMAQLFRCTEGELMSGTPREELPTDGDNQFRLCRKRAGLTQREAAEKLGVTEVIVNRWEKGKSFPRGYNLVAIAKLYDCMLEDLINV